MSLPAVERTASDQGPTPVAVVDIGSNSVRLVVYDGAIPAPTPIFNEKILCGLGRSVASTGKLGAEATERALRALGRFRMIIEMLGTGTCRAIATAAVRDADDGAVFIAAGTEALGMPIDVLSGEREAELAAKGIMMGFRNADGIAGDLGGGSLELVDIARGERRHGASLPLGGLRLIDVTGDRIDKALEFADARIAEQAWLGEGRARTFYAVGGTWRALARMYMEHTRYPLRVMQGYAITTREAIDYCEMVRRTRKLSSLAGYTEVSKPRREIVPYGALVLERVLKRLEPREVVFSVFGIREGLIYEMLSDAERAEDPLLTFCNRLAERRSRSSLHGIELGAWTDAIFSGAGGLKETPEEERLRRAACLLSDIGWRAHPDYRGEQTLNLVAHAGLGNIDHAGRIFLALSVYFRHANEADSEGDHLSARLKQSVPRRALKRARILGAAVRAAHMLSIGKSGVIPRTSLVFEDGRLVLTLPTDLARLSGERLQRRFGALAQLLDCEAEIRMGT